MRAKSKCSDIDYRKDSIFKHSTSPSIQDLFIDTGKGITKSMTELNIFEEPYRPHSVTQTYSKKSPSRAFLVQHIDEPLG